MSRRESDSQVSCGPPENPKQEQVDSRTRQASSSAAGGYVLRRQTQVRVKAPQNHVLRQQHSNLGRPRAASEDAIERVKSEHFRSSPASFRRGSPCRRGSPVPVSCLRPTPGLNVRRLRPEGIQGTLYDVTRKLSARTQEAVGLKGKLEAVQNEKARAEEALLTVRQERDEHQKRLQEVAEKEAEILRREMEVEERVRERQREVEAKVAEEKQRWVEQMKQEVQKQWASVEERCRARSVSGPGAVQPPSSPRDKVSAFSAQEGCGKTAFFARLCPADKISILGFTGETFPKTFTGEKTEEGKTAYFARLPGTVKLDALRRFQTQRRSVGPHQRTRMHAPPSKNKIDQTLTETRQLQIEELDAELEELLSAAHTMCP